MAEAVVSGVVTRIGDLLVQEQKLLSGLGNQVERLQIELNLMQGFLKDADVRQDESESVRLCVAKIRDLVYDVDDIIGMYIFKASSERGGLIQKILKRCGCILYEGISVHKAGSLISNITAKIYSLKCILQNCGIRRSIIRVGGPNFLEESQRETYSHPEHEVVGLEDNVKELVEFLLKEEEGNRVASICGMGGLGKTTLARMVYNHPKVKQHFDCTAWVYISQHFQRRHVWEQILLSLQSLSREERDEIPPLTDAELADKLCQVQRERKCLVVLDDIWSVESWNVICDAFRWKDANSKILLTSRNMDVISHIDPKGFMHRLPLLNLEKSRVLFEKMAISWRQDSEIKFRMINLGREMVEYCGGLPLAITTLGGLLAVKQTEEEWEDVLKNVKSFLYVQDLRITTCLALSYNDLPGHLKLCFLYLGHFPEDFEIPTKELIRMWMGEGFISQSQHEEGREDTMEDVGERYFRELVQRSMVQVGKIGSLGRIKTCRIHDLMRDFCVSKAQNENFLQIMNIHSMEASEMHHEKIRRLAIIWKQHDLDPLLPLMLSKNYHFLRSLLCFQPHVLDSVTSMFKNFKLLSVLNLENCSTYSGDLPEDIGCLNLLKFFSLKNSNIRSLPSSLGNLKLLQTVDVRCWEYNFPVKVPNVFKKMVQLRHLYLPKEYRVNEKLELADLCCLLTLVNVELKTIQMSTSFKFSRLQVLGMQVQTDNNEWANDAIQILISSCPRVYKLNLYFSIKKLPEASQFSPKLAKLTLNGSLLEEDPMTMLEKLPNLKVLCLFNNAFAGKNMVCSERGFPLLQFLVVSELKNLEEWQVEEGAMPNLHHLKIENCSRLKTIPDGLRFITNLQELEIKCMPQPFEDMLSDKFKHVGVLVFQGGNDKHY
ncbi:putative disease resistance protein At1g50180 isoform X3 [Quercus robur]|uniref:putative disease resistance protein At1g50180 isoform X1 n=1 Tax=Quercus robur TaxID=38942 RepID=UPI0021637C4A|nr:putative disease resistance protein At1g50180 isoform X1 [Quercus robur]XP_050261695.1 putative disease resistance protein At1g50180 isoform X2 [Quercus robur]XP_050261696.1 putative disease resistance protein At1g50180 isoform X3 [Quercus robur]